MLQRLHLSPEVDGNIWQYANLASANHRHRHLELELNVVTRGSGVYLLGSQRYEIGRGDLLWLFPAQEHVLMEQTANFQMWIAVFKRRAIRRVAIDASASPLLQPSLREDACRRLTLPELAQYHELFTELASSPEPGLLNVGLAYVLLRAWKDFHTAALIPKCEVHPAVERAARMIRDGAAPSHLHDLARSAGLSPSRLSRLFKSQTGSSIVEFRNRQRLERFWQIYGDRQHSTMLSAALDAGFGSYPQFHRVFRSAMGCSPARYGHQRRS